MTTGMPTVHTVPVCSLYLSVSAQITLQITEPPETTVRNPKPVRNLTIVLDKGSSMEGSAIENARAALFSLLPSIIPQFAKVRLVLFNNKVEEHDLTSLSNHQLVALSNSLTTSASTCFETALKRLKVILRLSEHLSPSLKIASNTTEKIIFLSQAFDPAYPQVPNWRNNMVYSFANFLRSSPFSADVHCISLASGQDSALMSMLSAAGPIPGTFIHAQSIDDVQHALAEMLQIVTVPTVNAMLHFLNADGADIVDPVGMPFTPGPDNSLTSSAVFVRTHRVPDKARLQFPSGAFVNAVVVPHASVMYAICHSTDSPSVKAANFLQFVLELQTLLQDRMMFHITRLPVQMFCKNKRALHAICAECNSISEEIFGNLIPLAFTFNSKQAKRVLYDVLSCIDEFVRDFISPVMQRGPVRKQLFKQLAHQTVTGVRKTGTEPLFGKRDVQNSNDIASMDERLDAIVKSIDFTDEALFNNMQEYGDCVISGLDYKQAMQVGDCLCLSLEIQISNTAFANQPGIVIRRVGPSVVTADSFPSAVTHRPGDVKSDDADSEDVQSGIGMDGQSREVINGALPLFINEYHWSMARVRAKPLFASMAAALGVVGAADVQIVAISFLVLNALQDMDDKSEFWTRVTGWVSQVCTQVLRESDAPRELLFGEHWYADKSGEHRLQYLSNAKARLPICVANHLVFFTQVSIAQREGLLNLTEKDVCTLGLYAVVEEHRRRVHDDIVVLSPARKDELVNQLVCSAIDKYVPDMLEDICGQEEGDSHATEKCKGCFREFFKAASTRSNWKEEYIDSGGLVRRFPRLDSIIQLFSNKIVPAATLPSLSDVQKMALITLHVDFARSKDVRMESGKYQRDLDLILDNGTLWMRARFQKVLQAYVKKEFTTWRADHVGALDWTQAHCFALAESVQEVWEIVKGNLYIGRNITKYVQALLDAKGDCESIGVLWKMELLMNSDHADVGRIHSESDYDERVTRSDGAVWKPNKRWAYRLFERFVLRGCPPGSLGATPVEDDEFNSWVDLFPFLESHISVWSGRALPLSGSVLEDDMWFDVHPH